MGAKFVPCKCTGMVTVVTHTRQYINILSIYYQEVTMMPIMSL